MHCANISLCKPEQLACIDCISSHAGQMCTTCPNSNYDNFCNDCTTSEDGCIITCSTCNLDPKSNPGSDGTAARRKLAQTTSPYQTNATPLNISLYGGTCRVDFCPATAEGKEIATINPQCVATDCEDDTQPICTGNDGLQFQDTGNYCFPGEFDYRPLMAGCPWPCVCRLTATTLRLHFTLRHVGLADTGWLHVRANDAAKWQIRASLSNPCHLSSCLAQLAFSTSR